jgi:hypothetical protein
MEEMMTVKRFWQILLLLILLAALSVATAALAAGKGKQRNFQAHLSGANEVPSNDSRGTGQALVRIDRDETSLTFKLAAANLDGVTMAHIHCGPEGANGPVILFLYGPNPEGVTPTGLLSQGTATDEHVVGVADSEVCPGGVATLADLIKQIRAGNAYVNVHSLEFPPGEIRGQLR